MGNSLVVWIHLHFSDPDVCYFGKPSENRFKNKYGTLGCSPNNNRFYLVANLFVQRLDCGGFHCQCCGLPVKNRLEWGNIQPKSVDCDYDRYCGDRKFTYDLQTKYAWICFGGSLGAFCDLYEARERKSTYCLFSHWRRNFSSRLYQLPRICEQKNHAFL